MDLSKYSNDYRDGLTFVMNFLQVIRMSLESVALNIITCL